jgi:hypothetical protein
MDTTVLNAAAQFVQWGSLGFVALALTFGWLVPTWTYKEKAKDADTWKHLYELERDAHQHTRDAYAIQGERLQVAVESGKVTEQLLREARGRVALPPQPQSPG